MAPMSRRVFLKSAAALAGTGVFAVACGTQAPATPPAAQTSGAAPAASQATSAAPAAQSGQAATSAPSVGQAPVGAASGAPVPALLRSGSGEETFFNKAIDLFEKQHGDV